MLAIVRIALSRPYTFVVMAMLIVIFGVTAWVKTPTDIFPNIGIPVVAVVWTYNGLPPDDMSGRVIYYYERTLSAQVNDIEHIESQSLPGYGVVKVFFQPSVNINAALAQITAASQTVLKLLPPGITPPYVLQFNASSVPILQLALSSDSLSQAQIFDAGQNFIRPQLATVAGAAVPSPYGGKVRQVQIDLDQQKLQAYGLAAQDVVDAVARQNLITPVGHREDRPLRIYRRAQRLRRRRSRSSTTCRIRQVDGATVYRARRRPRPRRQPAADQHGARRRLERGADDDPQGGLGVDARRHRRRQGAAAQAARDPADEPYIWRRSATSRPSSNRRCPRSCSRASSPRR